MRLGTGMIRTVNCTSIPLYHASVSTVLRILAVVFGILAGAAIQ